MFKNLFSFNGRIRRTEYGISFIIYVICYVVIRITSEAENGTRIGLLGVIPMLWFIWSQGAKRCHDIGKSGWWQIIPFYFLWLLFEDGSVEWNEYGDNPKGLGTFDADKYEDPFSLPEKKIVYITRFIANSNESDYSQGQRVILEVFASYIQGLCSLLAVSHLSSLPFTKYSQ